MSGAQVGRKHVLTPEEMKKVIRLYSVELMTQTAIIDGFEKWRDIREVIVALEGVQGRAVF